jgi:hypothetical protein
MICSNIKLIAREESIELALREIHEWNQRDSSEVVIARSEATKQSMLQRVERWIASLRSQ